MLSVVHMWKCFWIDENSHTKCQLVHYSWDRVIECWWIVHTNPFYQQRNGSQYCIRNRSMHLIESVILTESLWSVHVILRCVCMYIHMRASNWPTHYPCSCFGAQQSQIQLTNIPGIACTQFTIPDHNNLLVNNATAATSESHVWPSFGITPAPHSPSNTSGNYIHAVIASHIHTAIVKFSKETLNLCTVPSVGHCLGLILHCVLP